MSGSGQAKFVLDANVFIEARKRYYAFDIAPIYWVSLIQEFDKGNLISIDRVKEELKDQQLAGWIAAQVPSGFWGNSKTREVATSYSLIINWVQAHSQFKLEAKAEFASVADSWLIAYAHAMDFIIVAEEKYSKDIRKRVPIPNVCEQFDVQYLDTFDMLRALGCQFT